MDSDAWSMTLVLAIFTLVTAVVVVVIWQVFATWRAKTVQSHEQEYRKLAQTVAATQQTIAQHLDDTSTQLADLHDRLTAVERLLREVD
ncbi:hypothetical protein [Plantactinospora sp. ZYX-F-223]|uniref:hypothetical protein n=1 Tax=Plantactinospora sp. ZYX-F-223 TaxID=3144103 RepID=UPI0031FE11E8